MEKKAEKPIFNEPTKMGMDHFVPCIENTDKCEIKREDIGVDECSKKGE